MDSQWEIHQKWGIYSEYIYIFLRDRLSESKMMQEILRLDEEKLDRHRDLMRRNLGPK
jgi:hypothetical protein